MSQNGQGKMRQFHYQLSKSEIFSGHFSSSVMAAFAPFIISPLSVITDHGTSYTLFSKTHSHKRKQKKVKYLDARKWALPMPQPRRYRNIVFIVSIT